MDDDRIEKIVELAAPISRVWRALTDHEEFGQWFRVDLEGPFKVGEVTRGRISYPGYEHMKWESVTERMDHERLFVFSWRHQGGDHETDNSAETKILVEFRLEPTVDGTRLTISESGFSALPDPQRFEAMRRNNDGWEMQMKNIAAHVQS